jgi:hypothetical protein
MCAMAKRINLLLHDNLPTNPPPDLFILEFAVNDYQGQDHKLHLDHKTDVFFEGFQRLALCAETVVYKLLHTYPTSAVVFLEFQTAIANRKTAAVLHMGVAKQYQIPVISYAETMFPDFDRLMQTLRPFDYSTQSIARTDNPQMDNDNNHQNRTDPETTTTTMTIPDPVLPYPHGCTPCLDQHIIPQFRSGYCKPICIFAERSGERGLHCDQQNIPGREPCYVSFLAHDAVHPSAVGHQIAADLIAEAIAITARDLCQGRNYSRDILPTMGFMVADPTTLEQYSDFVLVQDTMEIFAKQDPMTVVHHTPGFALAGDNIDRPGWIATNPAGNETVEYAIHLPPHPCYAVYVAFLKSYEHMGTFTIVVQDRETNKVTSVEADGLWEPRISIPSDLQVTSDNLQDPGCTGKCRVTVLTNPQEPSRKGNKVKIVTLSVRKCIAK